MRTVDTILESIEKAVANRESWHPSVWLEAAIDLVALMGVEQAKLYTLQQGVAQKKQAAIKDGMTVAAAKVEAEASDEYKNMLTQKAKIDRIIEMGRLAKQMARMAQDEMRIQ